MFAAAMGLARQIAQSSRHRLLGLKQQLTRHVHRALEDTYSRELAMHDKTFVGKSGTLAQIEQNFHQEVAGCRRHQWRQQPRSTVMFCPR